MQSQLNQHKQTDFLVERQYLCKQNALWTVSKCLLFTLAFLLSLSKLASSVRKRQKGISNSHDGAELACD